MSVIFTLNFYFLLNLHIVLYEHTLIAETNFYTLREYVGKVNGRVAE